jgi:dTMP kinase
LIIKVPGLPDRSVSLVAESDVAKAGFFRRISTAAGVLWRRHVAGEAPATDRMSGLFLSFEGIDGSGKSTQARLLAETLRASGRAVTLTREPGGSPGAEEIRRLVLEGTADRWSAETEILLFTAARRDHLEKTIRPALARGEVVICDRFADSTRIFQGLTRGDLIATVDRLHDLMIATEPDLTLLIDLDPALGACPRDGPRRQGNAVRRHGAGLSGEGARRFSGAGPALSGPVPGDRWRRRAGSGGQGGAGGGSPAALASPNPRRPRQHPPLSPRPMPCDLNIWPTIFPNPTAPPARPTRARRAGCSARRRPRPSS